LISSLQKRNNWKLILGLLALIFLYTGCSHEALIKPGDSIQVAYQKAFKMYQSNHYRDAAKAFKTVINAGRGTNYAKNAHYYLADSYFKSDQYLLAANAYDRFINLYPKSSRTQRASFMEAKSYYKLSPRYNIDQTNTHKAIQKFNLFISKYPNSDSADVAGKYVTKMRTKLAHKYYNAAQLYLRLDQYKAAIIYYNLTVDQYPGTSWAEQAVVRKIAAYVEYASRSVPSSKQKRYKKAVDAYQQYLQLFPKGKHRAQAKKNVQKAKAALADLKPQSAKKTSSVN